jgi:hypothetical protein
MGEVQIPLLHYMFGKIGKTNKDHKKENENESMK